MSLSRASGAPLFAKARRSSLITGFTTLTKFIASFISLTPENVKDER
jgi:hypothetical protein